MPPEVYRISSISLLSCEKEDVKQPPQANTVPARYNAFEKTGENPEKSTGAAP